MGKKRITNALTKIIFGILTILGCSYLLYSYHWGNNSFSKLKFSESWFLIIILYVLLISGLLVLILGIFIIIISDEKYLNIIEKDKKAEIE